MNRILTFTLALLGGLLGWAQVVTTSPSMLNQKSKDIVIYYHPNDAGSNKGLVGLSESTPIYAHVGVITDKSKSDSDWKYATKWLDNDDKYKLTYISANEYSLKIGDYASYFGVPEGENVKKIALVFRNATASKEGKTAEGGDIFVNVNEDGFLCNITVGLSGGVANEGQNVSFAATTSETADITVFVNGTQVGSKASATSYAATFKAGGIGEYEVLATAKTADGKTASASTKFAVLGASVAQNYPGGVPQMGAKANADGSVTFCFAAPDKNKVAIVGSWNDFVPSNDGVMNYQDYEGHRYFWVNVKGLDPDKQYIYYYLVDNKYKVGDPYAHLILDPYNDKYIKADVYPNMPQYPSKITDKVMLSVYHGNMHKDRSWAPFTIPAHSSLVIYELLLRDFTGTEGAASGNGTVRKAIEKIPYLKDLGVNAVELMPIMEFNGNLSWGYNTNFYFAPDKAYGTPDDYKDFIDICHQNGIAVILDIVFNQSDGLHPWYQMYSRNANPFYNATAPHDHSVLNDWVQDHALVQQQWTDCLRHWLTVYNVDGFRFDLVKGLGNNDSYKTAGTEGYNQSRINNMIRLHNVIKSVKPNGIHINEHLAGLAEEKKMGEDGQLLWGNFNYNFCQYTMGYASGAGMGSIMSNGRPYGTLVSYAESHDEERMGYKIVKYGAANVKNNPANAARRLAQAGVQLLLTPGPKMIWQFGELGADQTTKNTDNSNNTGNKTVIWNNLNDENKASIHAAYRACARLRQDNPELFTESSLTSVNVDQASVTKMRSMTLRAGNKEVIAFINPAVSGSATTIEVPAQYLSASNSQLITSTLGAEPVLNDCTNGVSVSLAPHAMAVFATKSTVNGIDDTFVGGEDALKAEAYGAYGEIIIVGEYNTAEVYDLAGMAQGRLHDLTPGIYIVKIDGNNAVKVAVK